MGEHGAGDMEEFREDGLDGLELQMTSKTALVSLLW